MKTLDKEGKSRLSDEIEQSDAFEGALFQGKTLFQIFNEHTHLMPDGARKQERPSIHGKRGFLEAQREIYGLFGMGIEFSRFEE